jgi:hypothetical protein
VSLILDALRKLEREKGAHEPGVLVVGSVPWGETSRTRRILLGAGAVLVLGLAVLAGWLLRRGPAAPPAAVPVAAPVTTTLPAPNVVPSPTPTITPPAALAQEAPPAPPIRLSRPPASEIPGAAADRAPLSSSPAEPLPATTPTEERQQEPTAPAAAPPAAAPDDLRLSAISRRDGKPVALINDRLVYEGDSFDGVRVIRIGEAEVEVEVKGQRRVLRF